MTSKYNQLFLFDCDAGRANIFSDKTIVYQVPSNCECYLFWNKDSKTVTDKLNQLGDISQIHLCPSRLENSKNSADGKLIYCLGKLVEHFQFILIVHGNDNIYKEVIESVIHDYGHHKIDQKKIYHPTEKVLVDLFGESRERNERHQYIDPRAPGMLKYRSIHELANIAEKLCLKCLKRFTDILSLCNHIKAKHKPNVLFSCACSFKCTTIKEFHCHEKEKQRQIIDRQGVVRCLSTQVSPRVYLTLQSAPMIILTDKTNQCTLKCSRRHFDPPGLFRHLIAKHGDCIDIRVQRCKLNIKHTLDEFCFHIGSQHTIVDIQ